jgi:hypothetical protein
MEDYRVKTGWRNHPKRKKLARRLGSDGVLALYDLWEFCAESRTDGDLTGLSDEDIGLAVNYPGDPSELVSVLVEVGLLERETNGLNDPLNGLFVHDWQDHNPWVAGLLNPVSVSVSNSVSNSNSNSKEVELVFDHYRTYHPDAVKNPKPASREWKAIKSRLAEGSDVATLCKAIDGCHKTPHNLGDNDRGQKYLGLELIMRSGDQVTRFCENDDNPPTHKIQGAFARTTQHLLDEWASDDKDGIPEPNDQVAGLLPEFPRR